MRNTKQFTALLGVLLISAVIYFVWVSFMGTSAVTGNTNQEVVCTMDAMQCPDGSWVGRSGPNCQFVCPVPVATTTQQGTVTVELALNKRSVPIQEAITLLEVTEDSRCPRDVQCIQAGTVRVKARLESGMGTATEIFTLGGTITTETEEFTLIAVRPETESQKTIAPGDYRFVFRVTKR